VDQPACDQHKCPIRPGDCRSGSQKPIQQIPQPQFLEQFARHQQRAPGKSVQDLDVVLLLAFQLGRAFQDATQVRKHSAEHVATAKIGDDALLDLAVFAVGFHDAQVFVDGAVGGRDFDGPDVHAS
jgi:hypothetical protein